MITVTKRRLEFCSVCLYNRPSMEQRPTQDNLIRIKFKKLYRGTYVNRMYRLEKWRLDEFENICRQLHPREENEILSEAMDLLIEKYGLTQSDNVATLDNEE